MAERLYRLADSVLHRLLEHMFWKQSFGQIKKILMLCVLRYTQNSITIRHDLFSSIILQLLFPLSLRTIRRGRIDRHP